MAIALLSPVSDNIPDNLLNGEIASGAYILDAA